jgi:tight adherence protein C
VTPGPLAGLAVLLGFAAAWEIAGARGEHINAVTSRALLGQAAGVRGRALVALQAGIAGRLSRAGLAGRVEPIAVLVAKLAGCLVGVGFAMLAAPAAPGRLSPLVGLILPVAGFLGPDAVLERAARRRRRWLVDALPDALDLLAVSAAAGRSPGAALAQIADGSEGPLARELAVSAAEVACGAPLGSVLRSLRDRVPGGEVAALTAAIERSRRYGSPLADQLRDQATTLRREQRRRIEENAARSAPKIQLVVALVLVPSVLLMILAGLIANSDALLGGF